jgi:hypothetical protein
MYPFLQAAKAGNNSRPSFYQMVTICVLLIYDLANMIRSRQPYGISLARRLGQRQKKRANVLERILRFVKKRAPLIPLDPIPTSDHLCVMCIVYREAISF